MTVRRLAVNRRWLVPAAVVATITAAAALGPQLAAQAEPRLPTLTPAQLLVKVSQADPAGLSGVVSETARLGLPDLGGLGGGGTSLATLATGTNRARVWYGGKDRQRVSLIGPNAETSVYHLGADAWTYDSAARKATHYQLPAEGHGKSGTDPTAGMLTPQAAADKALAAIDPSTAVSVGANQRVAGRPAYTLRLAPKAAETLVQAVTVDVDSATGVPLRVQVLAKGGSAPALSVGYTSVSFAVPSAATFAFAPPQGTAVQDKTATAAGHAGEDAVGSGSDSLASPPALAGRAARPTGSQGTGWYAYSPANAAGGSPAGHAGPRVIGSGWDAVLMVPDATAGTAGDRQTRSALRTLSRAATPVSGAFGSGQELRTRLVTLLLTNDGRLYVGAVTPAALEAVAASSR